MRYQCLECGHKANHLKQGRCPACGASKVTSLEKGGDEKEKEAQPVRLLLMLILWGVLLYKGYETFIA